MRSLADIVVQSSNLSLEIITSVIQSTIESLSDYSTDQRGDIGSWIRITALSSLGYILSVPSIFEAMGEPIFDRVIGGIIKQSVEKLEPCRNQAYKTLIQLRQAGIRWEGCDALVFEATSRYVDSLS